MPKSLLLSQDEALAEPGLDESPIVVDVVQQPSEIVDRNSVYLPEVSRP